MSSELLKLQTMNFVHSMAKRSTNLHMTNYPQSGRGQDHMAHSRISHLLKYVWNGQMYSFQNFVCLQAMSNVVLRMADHP